MWNRFPQPSNFIKFMKILLLNGKEMMRMKQKTKEQDKAEEKRSEERRMEWERPNQGKNDDKNLWMEYINHYFIFNWT